MKQLLKKAFVLPLIVAITIAGVIYQVKSKPTIDHEPPKYPSKTVEVITAKAIPFRTSATAYGSVSPAVIFKAKAEVSGKIIYINPALKNGGSLAKDEVALRIEPTTFEFSLNQSKAVLASSQSSLEQLETEEQSTRTALTIARKNLTVGKKELARQQSIREKKLIAQSVVDAEEQKVLTLEAQVADLRGKLAGYVSKKASTQAQIKQSKSQLAQSKDTLDRTEITLPFNARIGEVSVENDEFVSIGNVLFEASGTEAVEIDAELPTRQFRPLLTSISGNSLNLQSAESLQNALTQMRLDAHVSLVGYEASSAHWQGKLVRIAEAIDPTRDTIGLVVSVNDPYDGVIPGKRPPLLKGMYAEVTFLSPEKNVIVIPRKAIHQGRVYIAKADNTLEIRPVTVLHKQNKLSVIADGINEGEKIIVTDVVPVINGLPLIPIQALEQEKALANAALGIKGAK